MINAESQIPVKSRKNRKTAGIGMENGGRKHRKKEGNFRKRKKIWPKGRKLNDCGIKNDKKDEILGTVDKIHPRIICKIVK